jgi:hypothetical protein
MTTLSITAALTPPANAGGPNGSNGTGLRLVAFTITYPDGTRSGVAIYAPGRLAAPTMTTPPAGWTNMAWPGRTTAAQFDSYMAAGNVFFLLGGPGTSYAQMMQVGQAGNLLASGNWMLASEPPANAKPVEIDAFTWGINQLTANMQQGAAATVAAAGGAPMPAAQIAPSNAPAVIVASGPSPLAIVLGLGAVVGLGWYFLKA